MNTILKNKILKKIKPSEKEKLNILKKVKSFIGDLEKSRKKLGIECEFIIGGSFGKGTFLRDDFDVDIFTKFIKSKNLSLDLEKILKNANKKISIQKGSRDYFQVEENNINFEIIPIQKLNKISDAQNSTEHSPYHVEFVNQKFQENPKLRDEIILAKQFFKAKKLYGAESYIGGFSGHSIDLLIIYYSSLENLIKNICEWSELTAIDLLDKNRTQKNIVNKIGKDKVSNLIIIDPVLTTRNAARALSTQNYFKTILISQEVKGKLKERDFFVKKENSKEFEKKAISFSMSNDLDLILYKIEIDLQKESKDIVGAKLLKIKNRIEDYFSSYEFRIFKTDFFISFDENICIIVFYNIKENLPSLRKVLGPKVIMKNDVIRFLKNKKKYFIENDRIHAYEFRKIKNLKQISKFQKKDLEKLLGKKISFIKSIKMKK